MTDAPMIEDLCGDLPQGDDAVWRERRIIWKQTDTWKPALTAWLAPRFREDGWKRLKPGVFRDLCWDDSDWLTVLQRSVRADVESIAESLADALDRSVLRVYHGCRTADARSYFEQGLRRHDRGEMRRQALEIVDTTEELAWLRGRVDDSIARVNNTIDDGRLYVVVGDEAMLDHFAHYLIYGSEWLSGVLGHGGRRVLRERGTPTMIEIDLPLKYARFSVRKEFAEALLMEWTRLICNEPDWIAPISFSISLQFDLPPELVVGHYHPEEMIDPHEGHTKYRPATRTCAYCEAGGD